MRKILAVLIATMAFSFTAFAGEWKQDTIGYWWQENDGSHPAGAWQWIDGNQDGIAECYYFNENGYLLTSTTTPDGNTVDADGCWVVNGKVQTQTVQAAPTGQNPSETVSSGFDFSTSNIAMKYVSHEVGTDRNGKTCVIIYYDFTNKFNTPANALWATMTEVYRNGQGCSDTYLESGTNQPYENYFKEIEPGQTVRVSEAFLISDLSDITVKVYEFYVGEQLSQTVTLKLQ